MRMSKKALAVGASAVVVLAGAGTALAYWTATGSGSGTATTGTSTPFTVAVTPAANNAALTPGGPVATYTATITNGGTGSQKVSTATATVAAAGGATWTAVSGCSAADYTVSAVTLTPTVVAAGGSVTGTFTVQMNNTASNQDACKGVSVPLFVTVS